MTRGRTGLSSPMEQYCCGFDPDLPKVYQTQPVASARWAFRNLIPGQMSHSLRAAAGDRASEAVRTPPVKLRPR